jgi:hypothetical protein
LLILGAGQMPSVAERFITAFLRSETKASDLGMEGSRLRDFVASTKALLFEQDEPVRRQVAREIVTGMRLFYTEALAHAGTPEAEAKARLAAAFGREGAIVNAAIEILPEPAPDQTKASGPLRRLFARRGLD